MVDIKYELPKEKIDTDEIFDLVFKDSSVKHGLQEFSKAILHKVKMFEKEQGRFYVKCVKRNKDIFVYDKNKKTGKPEEVIRQLWLIKLTEDYKYPLDRIEVEKSVQFGREVREKAADIVLYKEDRITPYIVFELKQPDTKKAQEQLKSYLSAEGAEGGVWSNGIEKFILYRPYPKEYVTALSDIPSVYQTWDDLFDIKKTYDELKEKFDLSFIISRLEEMVLAQAGVNVFEEVFKLIYAKLYDEDQAKNIRPNNEIHFRLYKESKKTYAIINDELFKGALNEWPDIFNPLAKIDLTPEQLQICIPFLEDVKFFGSGREELEIIDRAFEHLIAEVSKGQKGQYFTPRNVIKMCVKMLNPAQDEYIVDPACGSGGFLLHTMYWVWDNRLKTASQTAKQKYANRYLYGIDFDDNMRRISQALMLIAGDGRHNIFKRNSLDSRDWIGEQAEGARASLKAILHRFKNTKEDEENRKTYRYLNFDILMTNPPFAGEITDTGLLRQYEFAKKNGKLKQKVERHLLFIERSLDTLRPGGRMAIVLPQGVFNNTNMEWIREWFLEKARILAVVGLEGNTFKLPAPAKGTGTKTSVLFLQKWKENEEPLEDYPIFMAVSKKSGKDNSGEYIYVNGDGKRINADQGFFELHENLRLDDDLNEIAEEFVKFAKKERFEWWAK
ncbi:MAG: Type I restriction enzyme EcoKI M protein [Syntrophorhabdus sp. PtaU1.Bin058]|nr:MAG: Type I restriction enzyme EcoKI M protein [Syntrophorhabdus sp. PtaU1.Bin058]